MNNRNGFFLFVIVILFLFITYACNNDNPIIEDNQPDQVIVRMEIEPETVNPMLATSSIAREIYQYLFSTLADYDYETLELKPVLIKELPIPITIEDGPNGSVVRYDIEIKEDATWNNGTSITANDVLFTLKLAAHPKIKSSSWKYLLGFISHVELNDENPKKISIYSNNASFQVKDYIVSIEVYPKHIFDKEGVLSNYSFADMIGFLNNESENDDTSFLELAKEFSSLNFAASLEGAGPYFLENRETSQFIVLRQKDNYWGDNYPDIDQLKSVPDRIIYQIVKDPTTATTLLKNGEIDIMDMSKAAFANFNDLKKDPVQNSKLNFYTPEIPRFLFFNVNNDDPRLSDKNVRIALDHLTDKERMINQLEGGYAKVANSIVLSSKKEFNDKIGYRDYDVKKAVTLLGNSGWSDSNNNGTIDKIIDGRLVEMNLRFHYTGSDKSTAIVNIFKESCKQAGIEIIPMVKPRSATVKENLIPGDYEFTVSRITSQPAKTDPGLYHHSSSIADGGRNYDKFSNERADELIETIRETDDEKEEIAAYREFQQIMYDECPIIFLYSDQLRIAASKDHLPVISEKNPCYFVNVSQE